MRFASRTWSRRSSRSGGGQVVAAHTVLSPWYTPLCPAHCAWVSTTHVMTTLPAMQHAPVGGGGAHAVSVHTVPFPRYVPCWPLH